MGQAMKGLKPTTEEVLALRLALRDYMKDGRGWLLVLQEREKNDGLQQQDS